ncbi:MAG TPA: hypothetical protein VLJ19_18890 [Variovorax sp.]|nr:hypothetical protein [Variovorax sp.]
MGAQLTSALRLLAPLLVLNALLTLENLWPTLWPRLSPRLSFELAMALLALCAWTGWRGAPGKWMLRALAALSAFWILARYIDVTVLAMFGRPLNLYWDSRHVLSVLRMGEFSAWQLGLAGLLLLALPLLLHALALFCWRLIAQALLQLPRARPAVGATGLLLLASFAAHGIDGRDTRFFFSLPVAPALARQAELLADQLLPGAVAAQLPPSPRFEGQGLSGLAGADVLLIFAESYGASTLDDPLQSGALAPARARFEQLLSAGGRQVVSARVRSPTFGGASWLAHAALLAGVDTQDPGTYERLLATQRPTLVSHFQSHGWRTVSWMPGLQRPWPEGLFYGFERYADAGGIGYAGPSLGYWRIPDQASMALLHAQELAAPGARRAPRFIVFPTLASHAPFRPIAPFVGDWARLVRADAYAPQQIARALEQPSAWSQPVAAYIDSLDYTFQWLGSYLAGPAPARLLTIVIGDHQPLAAVSGKGASWDVPVHVISADARLLERFEALGFVSGLAPPAGEASVPMDGLTSLLLAAFDTRPLSASAGE